jgi:hypothetical protein
MWRRRAPSFPLAALMFAPIGNRKNSASPTAR